MAKPVTADTFLGNTVHRTLNELYKALSLSKVLTVEEMLYFYQKQWEGPDKSKITVVGEQLDVDDYIVTGEKMLRKYYKKYHPFDQGTTIGTELSLWFTLPGTDKKFRAIIDRLWRRNDGVIEICDYKTGQRFPQGERNEDVVYQMGLYQLAVKENYPQFETIELVQYFLRLDEAYVCALTEEDLDELVFKVKAEISQSDQAERLDDFPTKESGLCNYCNDQSLCPAKRHRLILDDESGKTKEDKRSSAEVASELAERYLNLDSELKQIKAQHSALRADLIKIAAELDLAQLSADSGSVSIKRKIAEKFITKTANPEAFADLSSLLRKLNLDDYFEPNLTAIAKEVYSKGVLSEEDETALKQFIVEKEDTRVTIRRSKPDSDDD